MADSHFDEPIARHYDERSSDMFDPAVLGPTVDFLAELAGNGGALEFGVGTGRVALPLAERGVPVHGVDSSPAMVERLAAKPGGDAIGVTIGDFATTKVEGAFSLVYLVFNTIMNLTTQDEQVACFANAAEHLAPGGSFVIEVIVPEVQKLAPGETIRPFAVEAAHLGFDEYDVANQTLVSHHYWFTDGEIHGHRVPFRYAWPAEFDLMARMAGMTLEGRWADWDRSPFTADSPKHVSVWEKAAE